MTQLANQKENQFKFKTLSKTLDKEIIDLKNDVLRILDETQNERVKLEEHKLYYSIQSLDDLKIFMENHVFAVWDFMSILKSLQSQLTCTSVPWIPSEKGTPARLVNEIVLEEETDIDQYGQYVSHFEMYCNAMVQVGANTGPSWLQMAPNSDPENHKKISPFGWPLDRLLIDFGLLNHPT